MTGTIDRMDLGHPLKVVTPTVDGDVLRVLAPTDAEFTAPGVQRMIGEYSVDGVRKSLERLSAQGIVLQRAVGNASLYVFNRSHLAAPAIIELAGMKAALMDRIRGRIRDWTVQCSYSAMFGSAVRGEMRAASDIDLFIVRSADVDADNEAWAQQLIDLSRSVREWTGNAANILEYGEDDVAAGGRSKDPVLLAIEEEGIRLHGPSRYFRAQPAKVIA